MEPLQRMGGCNLKEEKLDQDIRYTGIKISDPCGKIPGVFDLTNHIITYSPIFPFFYDERDLVKFADDTYFTSMTFEEIIINEIDISNKYYVHTGNYKSSKDILKYGSYIYEQIDKNQMIEYATNPEKGYQLIKKHLTNISGNH